MNNIYNNRFNNNTCGNGFRNYTYNNGMKNINTNTMSSSEIRSREEHNLKVLNKNFKQKMKSKKIDKEWRNVEARMKKIEIDRKLNKEQENNRKKKN